MKFDYIIGNPPYQEETDNTSDKPIYDRFMDETFKIGDTVELITPARFLYNVGKTPKNWNHKILNDTHFKPLKVYRKSYEVFPNTDIKGGVVISLRDKKKVFGPLVSFSSVEEMQPILSKILDNDISFTPITDIIYPQNKFNLIALYEWNPKFSEMVGSGGNEKRLTTSIFTTLPEVFDDTSGADKVSILGLIQNKRIKKFINRKFLKEGEELDSYKVFVSEANGNGDFGEKLSNPVIGSPGEGITQSFLAFGAFKAREESENLLKYLKTKFVRALLGTKKVTQHNSKRIWSNIPIQDFTINSDIDWALSVSEIDQCLYKKYGLNEDEIDFIETNVKEME